MSPRRLLITGGSGYLGQALLRCLENSESWEVLSTVHSSKPGPKQVSVDLRDETSVSELFQHFRPDHVIHTAGSNRQDLSVIRAGTKSILNQCARSQAYLINISTDVVFDGHQSTPYKEDDQALPLGDYGRAKLAGEALVASYQRALTVRTSLIYDLQRMDHQSAWIAACLEKGQAVTLFEDQLRQPIWSKSLSLALLELASKQILGRIHVAGREVMSRADFAQKLLNYWNVPGQELVRRGLSDPQRWPQCCTLDTSRAESLLSVDLLGVSEVLARQNSM